MIRPVKLSDAEQLAEIYNYYILNSTATFEEEILSAKEMGKRIQGITEKYPYLVYEEDKQILGYAYAASWKTRIAYRHSVEASIYIREGNSGKGIGTRLYNELIFQLREMDFHAVLAGISLPNAHCIALHEKFGFKKVGEIEQIGYKFAKWINVGYWELILEE